MKLRNLILAFSFASSVAATATPTFAADGVTRFSQPPPTVVQPPPPVPEVGLDRAAVKQALAVRRKTVIERFSTYHNTRRYPVSAPGEGKLVHTWLDAYGRLCAAATLVSEDWGREAAINAGRSNNHLTIANARTGALNDWVLTSGLTRHELVAIQVPGFSGGRGRMRPVRPETTPPRSAQSAEEIQRLFDIYTDVERQLVALDADSLDEATDALMKRPDLARTVLAGGFAGAGELTSIDDNIGNEIN